MALRIQFFLLVFSFKLLATAATTSVEDYTILKILMSEWQNTPPNWVGTDPCGDKWVGIRCTNQRVTSISLASMGLRGLLPSDIVSLTELQILDLSNNGGLKGNIPQQIGSLAMLSTLILLGCSFSGQIPNSIGNLTQLRHLSLNANSFSGSIPPWIGNMKNLYWLDLTDNILTGTIPVSNGTIPGLDWLVNTRHFHFGENQLTGTIPAQLFSSKMKLIHVLFDNNKLTGGIPSTLGLVTTLEVVRFDRNSLNGTVPSNLNNLTRVQELYLSNNQLTGPISDLTGMNTLFYLDMSNNSFNASSVPLWTSSLQSLTALVMENTNLQGEVPSSLFSLPQLQTVDLSNNQLNGTLNIGSSPSSQLQLIDLHNNSITYITLGGAFSIKLVLVGNPVCKQSALSTYCTSATSNANYSTPSNNCLDPICSSNKTSSPNCSCAYPYAGTLVFRAPSFLVLNGSSYYHQLEGYLMAYYFNSLPVDSVSLSDPMRDSSDYLHVSLKVFPSGQDSFNRTAVSAIGFILSKTFGPFSFIALPYLHFADSSVESSKSSNTGIVIGEAVGGTLLVLLVIIVSIYALRQKRRAERFTEHSHPFASWDLTTWSGSIPKLKGARRFSFKELKKCTNNFSDANEIGSGGYGKVYRGSLLTGQLLAIKRAQQGSMQGGNEFKNEIELLSRVHHKNLVSLVGFCFEQGEQMLVYEYIPNGTLKDCLSGKSGIRLDWMRRLKIALGSARGLAYLHELANPPIIHRDVKTTNILLDEHLNAKVSDFGLSKPKENPDKDRVTTQVKGTMGYMDREYYMTQQLTEKSDVYSFGVVLLELLTARKPIEKGKHIVCEVKTAMDKTKNLYSLYEILDPVIASGASLGGLENFVDLAMHCVEESGVDRPTMGEVVKEIENIMQLAGLNPNAESASTSASYEEYGGGFPSSKLEPK